MGIKGVIICIGVALVLLAGSFIAGIFVGKGTDTGRIDNLENTIGRLSAINQQLKYINSGLEENYIRLQDINQRLEDAVGRLESGVESATGFIRDAIETSGRIEQIITETTD